jgi:hypothetical protein
MAFFMVLSFGVERKLKTEQWCRIHDIDKQMFATRINFPFQLPSDKSPAVRKIL